MKNEYYEKVDVFIDTEYMDSLIENMIDFPKNEIAILCNHFKHDEKFKFNVDTQNSNKIYLRPLGFESYDYIITCKDEWYVIYCSNKGKKSSFYKCDQLDGLIKCIEDIYGE